MLQVKGMFICHYNRQKDLVDILGKSVCHIKMSKRGDAVHNRQKNVKKGHETKFFAWEKCLDPTQ